MIDHFDRLLSYLFRTQVPALRNGGPIADALQVGFGPPDDTWRAFVDGLNAPALNVYLVELRENNKLRSNERTRRGMNNGNVLQEPAPARVDCHYLVSAWSPAAVTPATAPTVDEHELLYQALAVLWRNVPIRPWRVYPPGSAEIEGVPDLIREVELPTAVVPSEGFGKLPEFWGTMGANHRWKPVIQLVVTLPVALDMEIAGPMVTTLVTDHRITGRLDSSQVLIQIGGRVLSQDLPIAVGGAAITAVPSPTRATVANPGAFAVGDVVTVGGSGQAVVEAIAGGDVTLKRAIGLTVGATLRLADLAPSQRTIRLQSTQGLRAGQTVVLRGEDARAPGQRATELATIESVAAGNVVTLAPVPRRTVTLRMDVAQANAPMLGIVVEDACVQLETSPGGVAMQTTHSDALGQFQFEGLKAGPYQVRVRAAGFVDAVQAIEVPSPQGGYDVAVQLN